MNVRPEDAVALAAEVVAVSFADGVGPGDAMARLRDLRRASPALRAEVLRLAMRAVGSWRRLAFALGLADRPGSRSAARRLVIAGIVDAGEPAGTAASDVPPRAQLHRRLREIGDPDRRLAITGSIADWLAPRLRAAFGDECDALLAALRQPAPRTLRANLLRVASRDELVARLRRDGVRCGLGQYADTAVHVHGTADVFRTASFRDGLFEQQDEASQLAVAVTAPPPGGRVLDLCCGSGGKTLALAAALGNRGTVLAADVHRARVAELKPRLKRAGVDNVRALWRDGSAAVESQLAEFGRRADRILIDAPCTGTGSWRRRPQARWQIGEADLDALGELQRTLLDEAARWLRPGARIVYATCSLLPDENDRQVDAFLDRHGDFEVVRVVEILGGDRGRAIADAKGASLCVRPDRHGTDGFFATVLRRCRPV